MKYLLHPCVIVVYVLVVLWIFFPATLSILPSHIQFFVIFILYDYYTKYASNWWNNLFDKNSNPPNNNLN